MLDQLLEQKGIKYESLNDDEKSIYYNWLDMLQKSQITVDKIKEYVIDMKNAVTRELVDEPEEIIVFWKLRVPNRKHLFLKARLKNYILFENMLNSPEKARKMIESQLEGAVKKLG